LFVTALLQEKACVVSWIARIANRMSPLL